MNNKLYVGQLSFAVDSNMLGEFFASAGDVLSAKVITDRDSGRSKGFGFVEMATDQDAQNAIQQFNGKDFNGRAINVSIAKPQEDRPRRSGGGGFGGGGRSGGNGGGGRGGFNRGY